MDAEGWLGSMSMAAATPPRRVTRLDMEEAVEAFLVDFTKDKLEPILYVALGLTRPDAEPAMVAAFTKRQLVRAAIGDMSLPKLVKLAQRIVSDVKASPTLEQMIEQFYAGGGVSGEVKNLIFAADGPKPDLVLQDAVSNEIAIVRNAEYCLVYDRPIGPEGLSFADLVQWWRAREALPVEQEDRTVALLLYERLKRSLAGNAVEIEVFDAYAGRYAHSFDIPALIPQVYLHYDPYTRRERVGTGVVLERQRMDFLLLFSQRRRVVIEVDGVQHYAGGDGRADTSRYAAMVAEDRRLKLAGYEVYRFGGKELDGSAASRAMLSSFFDELALSSRS